MTIRKYDPQVYFNYLEMMKLISGVRIDNDDADLDEKRKIIGRMGINRINFGGGEISLERCLGNHLRIKICQLQKRMSKYLEEYKDSFEGDRKGGLFFGEQQDIQFTGTIANSQHLDFQGIKKHEREGYFRGMR